MQFISNLSNESIDLLAKTSNQLSTTLRTFSRFLVSTKKKGSETPVCGVLEIEQTSPKNVLKKTKNVPKKSTFLEKNEETHISREQQAMDWTFSKKCRWAKKHATHFAEWFLAGKYRADRFKNMWVCNGENPNVRSSWTKVPFSVLDDVFVSCADLLEESQEMVVEARDDKTIQWKQLRPTKRKRVDYILKAEVGKEQLLKLMRERHLLLPALRS